MKNYLAEYWEIRAYIENYDSREDFARQLELVSEYWIRHCVKTYHFFIFRYTVHDEDAKHLWEDLDYMVRQKIRTKQEKK